MTTAAGVVNHPASSEEQGVEYRRFVKERCRWALWLTLAAAVVLVLSGHKAAARGVALGGLFSTVNFFIMSQTLTGRMARTGWSGKSFGFIWILIRLGIMALPLVAAFRMAYFNIVATAAGLFAIQAALLLQPLISRIPRPRMPGRKTTRD